MNSEPGCHGGSDLFRIQCEAKVEMESHWRWRNYGGWPVQCGGCGVENEGKGNSICDPTRRRAETRSPDIVESPVNYVYNKTTIKEQAAESLIINTDAMNTHKL